MPLSLTDLTPEKRDWRWAFLKRLAETANVSAACIAAGVSRDRAYRHRERFSKFRAKWDEALEVSVELLEHAARSRALDKSDPASHVLMIFLLKAHRPRVYRDNAHQIPPDPPPDYEVGHADLSALSTEELAALGRIAGKLAEGQAGGSQAGD